MSSITAIIEEVAAAAKVDDQRDDPEAHAALLRSIQRLQLAVEKPTETAKRIIYQVRVSPVAPCALLENKTANLTVWRADSHQPTPPFVSP